MMVKIETKVDEIIDMVKKRKQVGISDLVNELKVDRPHIEEWARILDDQNVLRLVYPTNPLSDMYLREITEQEKEMRRKVFRVEKIKPAPAAVFEKKEKAPDEESVFMRLAGRATHEGKQKWEAKKEAPEVLEVGKKKLMPKKSFFQRLKERFSRKPKEKAPAKPAAPVPPKKEAPAKPPALVLPKKEEARKPRRSLKELLARFVSKLPKISLHKKPRPVAHGKPTEKKPEARPVARPAALAKIAPRPAKHAKPRHKKAVRHVVHKPRAKARKAVKYAGPQPWKPAAKAKKRKRMEHAAERHRRKRATRFIILQSLIDLIRGRRR
jgi:hypothetical protein